MPEVLIGGFGALIFFFQAEGGIRDLSVTGVQTCALPIYSGETDYLLWFAMPYLPGETLRQVLRREGRLAVDRATRAACETLDALGHAHQHGIAHRDIKPDNIVLSPDGAVLVDLGIARAIATSGDDRVTRSGFVVGTEEYMSPEQATGSPDVDGRTDLYSLGIVLFESLAGRPPSSPV